ncbi:MAG: hypothetical protein QXW97_02210 [Candidatus Pacearchaeota archaeon]
MLLKPNFKPTYKKVIFSTSITIIWIVYNILTAKKIKCECSLLTENRLCYFYYLLIPIKNYVCCKCAPLLHLIIQIIIYIIIPFLIAYIVFTLVYALIPKKHKRGIYR